MSDVPDKIINKNLYRKIRREIFKEYPKNSAYRSLMIIKEYKKAGGKIKDEKTSKLNQWLDEEWINVYAYLKENKIVKCGDRSYIQKSACRPLNRINDTTPSTIGELLKKHSKEDILKAIKIKNSDPQNLIMRWDTLTIYKKKTMI